MRINVYICIIFTLMLLGCGEGSPRQPEVDQEEFIVPTTSVQTLLKCNASKGSLTIQEIGTGEISGIEESKTDWVGERFVNSFGGAVTSLGKIYNEKSVSGIVWNEGRVVKVSGDDVGIKLKNSVMSLEGYSIDSQLKLVAGTDNGLVIVSGEKIGDEYRLEKIESEIEGLGEVTSVAISKMILVSGWPAMPVVYFVAGGDLYFADIGTLESESGCLYKIYSAESNLRNNGTPKRVEKVVAENDYAAFYVKDEEVVDGLYSSSAWIVDVYDKETPLREVDLRIENFGEVVVSDIVLNSGNLYFASSLYRSEEETVIDSGIAVYENIKLSAVLRNYLKVTKPYQDNFFGAKLDVEITTAYLRGIGVATKVYSVVDDYLNQVWEFEIDLEGGAPLESLVWRDSFGNLNLTTILDDLSLGVENLSFNYKNIDYEKPDLVADKIAGLDSNSVSYVDVDSVVLDSLLDKLPLVDKYYVSDPDAKVEASFGSDYASMIVVGMNGTQELRVFEVDEKEISGLGDSVGYNNLELAFDGFPGGASAEVRDVIITREMGGSDQIILLLLAGRYNNINLYRVAAYQFDIESGSVNFVAATDSDSPLAFHHSVIGPEMGRVSFVGDVQKEDDEYRVYIQSGVEYKNAFFALLKICKGKSKYCETGGDLIESEDPYVSHSVGFYKDADITLSVNQSGIVNIVPENSLPHIYDLKMDDISNAEILKAGDLFLLNIEAVSGKRTFLVMKYDWDSKNYEVVSRCERCNFKDIAVFEDNLASINKYGELLVYDLE